MLVKIKDASIVMNYESLKCCNEATHKSLGGISTAKISIISRIINNIKKLFFSLCHFHHCNHCHSHFHFHFLFFLECVYIKWSMSQSHKFIHNNLALKIIMDCRTNESCSLKRKLGFTLHDVINTKE